MKRKILYISSEAFPLIKTGGLADVAGSLPPALQQHGHDVRLLLPGYQPIVDTLDKKNIVASTVHYGHKISILQTLLPGTDIITWLIDCPQMFGRPGNPYLNSEGQPWPDNAIRFALFSQAAVDIAINRCGLDWQADVVNCNDWQSALVPALLQTFAKAPATVFSIHNLAYQGLFSKQTFFDLGLPAGLWGMHGLEFYDQFSFIKGGLVYADRINTVSPTYAEEIQHPLLGYGLENLLASRSHRLSGILNGIDTDIWDPQKDRFIDQHYGMNSLHLKSSNKKSLQQKLDLPVDENITVFGMISRLVEQKGLQSILDAMHELMQRNLQIVILGSGEKHFEDALRYWAGQYPDKLSLIIGYNEQLAHLIESAVDVYLMPSMFEPCGLNQLYSLRYGTLPLARNVGGLADTVIDTTDESINKRSANGFIVYDNNADSLVLTVDRALETCQNPDVWRQLQINAMTPDRSWQSSALQYIDLYEKAIQDNSHRNL